MKYITNLAPSTELYEIIYIFKPYKDKSSFTRAQISSQKYLFAKQVSNPRKNHFYRCVASLPASDKTFAC